MQYPDLKEIERRPRQYWNADGLPDLMIGALWIVWGAAFLLPDLLPPGEWMRYYWMLVAPILIGGGAASNWAIKRVKERLTFPRTGYVEWTEPGFLQKTVPALLAAGVAAGVVLLVRQEQSIGTVVAPAVALILAMAFLAASVWQKLPHYLWSAGMSLTLALVFASSRMSLARGLECLFLVLGALSVLIGALRLRAYLRRNPVTQGGEA